MGTSTASPFLVRSAMLILSGIGSIAMADPPAGYYATVDDTSSATLRTSLHAVIDDHIRFPYTSSGTDTWDILEQAQENPGNTNQIIDIYRNRTYTKIGGGSGPYNREHTWPKSYGFPDDGGGNYPFTDCHQLHLCDTGYNSSRANKPFRNCSSGCSEETTDANNGEGGGSGSYPGNSNWTSGSTWETWSGSRGDIARSLFYLDLRYEGGTHGTTNHDEPDLILTNSEALIESSSTGSNEPVAYMGILSVLRQWHLEDPVDDFERDRNDVVFGYQGNRNPFVDHPEWVACLFDDACAPSPDCNTNGIPDESDITAGNSMDCNGNGIPDECDLLVYGDLNDDGFRDLVDITCVINAFLGTTHSCLAATVDLFPCTPDGVITIDDLLAMIDSFSGNPRCPESCE